MFDSSIALGNMELMFLINFQSSVEREYTKVQPSFWVFEGDRGKKKKKKEKDDYIANNTIFCGWFQRYVYTTVGIKIAVSPCDLALACYCLLIAELYMVDAAVSHALPANLS